MLNYLPKGSNLFTCLQRSIDNVSTLLEAYGVLFLKSFFLCIDDVEGIIPLPSS